MAEQLNWTRDELILALELYLEDPKCKDRKNDPKLVALSDLLRNLPIYPVSVRDDKFRNPAGVGRKLFNLAHHDPNNRGASLPRGSKLDKAVWDEFAGNPAKLKQAADAIRAWYASSEASVELPDEPEGDEEAAEGRILTRVHKRRERDRKIIARKKETFLKKHGRLYCKACEFDFLDRYGERGRDFVEVHHTVAVSALQPGEKTKLSDLRLACSNCHRMIHRNRAVAVMGSIVGLNKLTSSRSCPPASLHVFASCTESKALNLFIFRIFHILAWV